MFDKIKKLFRKNTNEELASKNSLPKRDLFTELFPLNESNKMIIEKEIKGILSQMFNEKDYLKMLDLPRFGERKEVIFAGLNFDTMGWSLTEESEVSRTYQNELGDFFNLSILQPNGSIKKDSPTELPVYQNWMRKVFIREDGGLLHCENITHNGFEAYESIGKIPREESSGMDYVYFLNIRNYDKQKLYQLMVKVHEGPMTGLRDNLMIHPICKILDMDMMEVSKLYNKDPYDKNIKKGNTMNLSECEEFDYLFPIHPLSIIREKLQPRLLETIKFVG